MPDGPSPAVDPTWLDGLDADISSALAALPEGQRRAIEVLVLEDRGYDDIARARRALGGH